MKRNVINVLMGIFALLVLVLTGCGSGGGGNGSAPASIEFLGWYFDNAPAGYYQEGTGVTCYLHVALTCGKSVAPGDISSFSVISPTGVTWTISASNSQIGTTSTGNTYISSHLYDDQNPQTFPLAGVWTGQITLKDGRTASIQRTLHEPGSTADATHQYLYTAEDWTPSTNPSQYVAALGRFPSQGYSVQYSSANGTITTTGFSAVRASFLAAQPNAYNMVCWLYDASNQYLGRSDTEYSPDNHSNTGLVTAGGELLITTDSTVSLTGKDHVDLSKVKYISIVYLDGAQYAPSSYSTLDYRSISTLVPVN